MDVLQALDEVVEDVGSSWWWWWGCWMIEHSMEMIWFKFGRIWMMETLTRTWVSSKSLMKLWRTHQELSSQTSLIWHVTHKSDCHYWPAFIGGGSKAVELDLKNFHFTSIVTPAGQNGDLSQKISLLCAVSDPKFLLTLALYGLELQLDKKPGGSETAHNRVAPTFLAAPHSVFVYKNSFQTFIDISSFYEYFCKSYCYVIRLKFIA